MVNTYSFDEIKEYIVGKSLIDDYFAFYIYSNHAPRKNDIINVDGVLYEVESVIDDVSDIEIEEGISFSCVYMQKI